MKLSSTLTSIGGLSLVWFLIPELTFAQFVPLIPIPGLDPSDFDFEKFLEVVYILAISAAALIAVVKLMLAGFKYIVSELVTEKMNAKADIQSALIGLLIILVATVILTTINTSLTNLPTLNHAPLFDGLPTKNVNVIKISNPYESEVVLSTCENLIKYPGDEICCNDSNTCTINSTTESEYLEGFVPAKIYNREQYLELLQSNQNLNIIDLGLSDQYSVEQNNEDCASAAVALNTELLEVIVVNRNIGSGGTRHIKQQSLCIIE